MFQWFKDKKKQIILGVVVAAIVASTGLPQAAVLAIADSIYTQIEQSSAKVPAPEQK